MTPIKAPPASRYVVIAQNNPRVKRFSMAQAQVPCRAEKIIRDSWWVVDNTYWSPRCERSLIFLESEKGFIPQQSIDDMVIGLMKRILFPWAEIVRIREVFLVRHKQMGWQIPYGRIY